MKRTKQKSPRIEKTKEQLVAEARHQAQIAEQRKLGEEKIFPILLKHDLTVYKTTQILEIVKTVIFSKMNSTWEGKNVSELGLIKELTEDKDAKDREIYMELFTAIDDQNISKMLKFIETLERVVDMYGSRKVMEVRFKDLPVNEIMK